MLGKNIIARERERERERERPGAGVAKYTCSLYCEVVISVWIVIGGRQFSGSDSVYTKLKML